MDYGRASGLALIFLKKLRVRLCSGILFGKSGELGEVSGGMENAVPSMKC